MKLTILDYGAGNVPSVERAFRRLGAITCRATEPANLENATALVLPGVGHFGALTREMRERHWLAPLRAALDRSIPFLGICLGMQALYEGSVEAPGASGLGLFRGTVEPLPTNVKLPHMGWNQLRPTRPSTLLHGVPAEAYFYFAHSYATLSLKGEVTARCCHGTEFAAVVEQGNLFGVQFHPEKSGEAGARVLGNFLELLS